MVLGFLELADTTVYTTCIRISSARKGRSDEHINNIVFTLQIKIMNVKCIVEFCHEGYAYYQDGIFQRLGHTNVPHISKCTIQHGNNR